MGLFDFFKKKPAAVEPVEAMVVCGGAAEVETVVPRDPKYGLIAELPIAVADAEGYLSALKSAAGDALTWTQNSSDAPMEAEVWQSAFSSGVPYQTVYLRTGASQNPTTLPLGFTV